MPDKILNEYLQIKGSGVGCFSGGTLVHTPSGTIAIENVTVGQRILAFNSKCEIVETTVLEVHVHDNHELLKLKYWGGEVITTPNHWFYIDDLQAFEYAGKLNIDQPLRDMRGGIRPVEYVARVGYGKVFNLRVDKYHTFLVGEKGIFVHNGGGGKGGGGSPNEQDVDVLSRATIRIVELISEGPIEGFRSGQDIRQNIFLDDTPVRTPGLGILNFQKLSG